MSAAVLLLIITILLISIRLLQLTSQVMAPLLHHSGSNYINSILELCPLLRKEYVPTVIWGKSGHLQTILYGKMGRINSPFPKGERHHILMPDGATMTFDVFQPQQLHSSDGDYTLCVCPGIANSSEALYIRTFVHYAQTKGYRVAVLNHLGAAKDVELTSPRIFTYGGTEEYAEMVDRIIDMYPDSTCIAVGFSMGGNIVTKYLGESRGNQEKVLCGVSCGQGYDAKRAMDKLMSWEHLRRLYLWTMAQHMKGLLRRNFNILFNSSSYNVQGVFSATSLVHIDELYSRRRHGFSTLEEYYSKASCVHVLDNIDIPMFFLNALDDPLVPEELLEIPRDFASKKSKVLVAYTRHGGHLGYFEGGLLIPDTITWLDKVVIEYTDAMVEMSTVKGAETSGALRQDDGASCSTHSADKLHHRNILRKAESLPM